MSEAADGESAAARAARLRRERARKKVLADGESRLSRIAGGSSSSGGRRRRLQRTVSERVTPEEIKEAMQEPVEKDGLVQENDDDKVDTESSSSVPRLRPALRKGVSESQLVVESKRKEEDGEEQGEEQGGNSSSGSGSGSGSLAQSESFGLRRRKGRGQEVSKERVAEENAATSSTTTTTTTTEPEAETMSFGQQVVYRHSVQTHIFMRKVAAVLLGVLVLLGGQFGWVEGAELLLRVDEATDAHQVQSQAWQTRAHTLLVHAVGAFVILELTLLGLFAHLERRLYRRLQGNNKEGKKEVDTTVTSEGGDGGGGGTTTTLETWLGYAAGIAKALEWLAFVRGVWMDWTVYVAVLVGGSLAYGAVVAQ